MATTSQETKVAISAWPPHSNFSCPRATGTALRRPRIIRTDAALRQSLLLYPETQLCQGVGRDLSSTAAASIGDAVKESVIDAITPRPLGAANHRRSPILWPAKWLKSRPPLTASEGVSDSSGLPVVWGYTLEGVHIIVVYEQIDESTIRVITAYPVPEP